ncbi:dTDP-glucose 4,6-dehydratase [Bacillus carboniphilus]|uniref:dTDP-glucose 4,6-dehydratase n=1 Tax=Bacillus carboniphilus TaxID=86663 RepID=A0ABY9JQ53_9BACI|nr:dTDP-glucose 4,6-dehydratase [Bacillus carboniphilus]WLR41527.1 dTDP-glucose 4,6-dehydratase [Bacillus carboniphilus]
MTRKKILITGGAGFIGGNLVHYFLDQYRNYDIINVDLLTYAGELTKHQHIQSSDQYEFVQANIADNKAMRALFHEKKPNYVIHCAAESHVDRSIENPQAFVYTNVIGTQILLEAAKKVQVEKFIHVSTDEVYGELPKEGAELFTEETPLRPNSPYSASKASSDLLVRAYCETYGFPAVITRCSNNYGPFHLPEKLIPLTISRVMNNQEVPVYGDGKNIRDWLHVYDHCSAIDTVLHHGEIGQVYNIGSNNERTNLDVVKTIIKELNKSETLIEFVEDRPGHDERYAIDASKLKKLGWKPKFIFEEGIVQTIQWYMKNGRWWEQFEIK